MQKGKNNRRKNDKTAVVLFFLLPAMFFIIVFIAYPAVISAYYSFFDWKGMAITREFAGFKNWIRLSKDPVIKTCVINNFILVIAAVVIQVPFAFIIAFLLSRAKVFARNVYRISYFMPVILTVSVVGILWSWMYHPQVGLINYGLKSVGLDQFALPWLGSTKTALPAVILAMVWRFTGFYIILFMAAVSRIPDAIYDAAIVDGANLFQLAVNIVAPMLREVIKVAIIIAIVSSIKRFDLVYIMTAGGPVRATELLATYLFKVGIISSNLGYGSAIATLLFLLTLGLIILQIWSMRSKEVSEF